MHRLSLSLIVCAASAAALSQVKLSTPNDTVQSLTAAIKSGRVDDAAKCVLNAKPTPAVRKLLESVGAQGMSFSVHVQKPSYLKDTATAQIAATIGKSNRNSQSINETVKFKRTGSNWLIVSPAAAPPVQSFVNMAAFMLVKGDRFSQKQAGGAKSTSCLTNVKQLALGCIMYANDYDDILKLKAGTWSDSIMPYIKNKALFTCPLDKPGAASYSFNSALSGKNYAVVASPAQTVMIYEGKNKQLNFRHDGKATVGFADGHVKLVSKEEARSLRWNP